VLQHVIYQLVWYRQEPENRVVYNLPFIRHTTKKRAKLQQKFEIYKFFDIKKQALLIFLVKRLVICTNV